MNRPALKLQMNLEMFAGGMLVLGMLLCFVPLAIYYEMEKHWISEPIGYEEEADRDLHDQDEEGNGLFWQAGLLLLFIVTSIAKRFEKWKMGW